jgi:hypothetical protein
VRLHAMSMRCSVVLDGATAAPPVSGSGSTAAPPDACVTGCSTVAVVMLACPRTCAGGRQGSLRVHHAECNANVRSCQTQRQCALMHTLSSQLWFGKARRSLLLL